MTKELRRPQRLADFVIMDLKNKIIDQTYAYGERLPSEFELMKAYEVGRSTVREAIKILIHAGFLTIHHGQGTFVVYNEEKIQQDNLVHGGHIAETRLILEQAVVKLAVLRRTDEDLISLREALDRRNAALGKGNYSLYIQEDIGFHTAIAKAAHNDSLYHLYQQFSELLSVHLNRFLVNVPAYNDNTAIHERLYQAIVEHDETAALACVAANIEANEHPSTSERTRPDEEA